MYLNSHMASHDHLIEGSRKFMGESFLWYVTVLVKSCDSEGVMFLIRHATSLKMLYEIMGGSLSQSFTTLPCLVAIDLVQVEM